MYKQWRQTGVINLEKNSNLVQIHLQLIPTCANNMECSLYIKQISINRHN